VFANYIEMNCSLIKITFIMHFSVISETNCDAEFRSATIYRLRRYPIWMWARASVSLTAAFLSFGKSVCTDVYILGFDFYLRPQIRGYPE
jgi:hypothetical protein